jgi:outer membrane protein TolC
MRVPLGDLDIPHSVGLPTLQGVPAGMPSTLLQRFPDIAAAEGTMAAQNAAIGIALAPYYPSVSLSVSIESTAPISANIPSLNAFCVEAGKRDDSGSAWTSSTLHL